MCGICGSYSPSGTSASDEIVVREMMALLEHRGPDGDGWYSSASGAVLGHRRLAIIDLLGGWQPLFNETRDIAVIVNGEIYNYRELRQELISLGHTFRTNSDTESVVHAYEQWGDDFVTRLRGMFAFALWDEKRRRMLLGRDRFGVKPLYYAIPDGDRLFFASEIKALFAHPELRRSLNARRLAEYLMFRSVVGEETLFEGVYELRPATLMVLENGRRTERRYWSPDAQAIEPPTGDALEYGRELLRDSIRARLISDVRLGTITSGGLDSSLVSAIAAELTDGPIDTFCVGFGESTYDERPYARMVSERIRSRHHEIEVSAEQIDRELERLTWAYDEPLTHPNSVPMHLIFREAKERVDVTVLLSGEGADEVFGGYEWYRVALQRDKLRRRVPGVSQFAAAAPAVGKLATLKKVLRDDYLVMANSFADAPSVNRLVSETALASQTRRQFLPQNGDADADHLFAYDQQTYLVPLLQRQDRMSMAAGLEAREPFLDHHLVEWANGLPANVKLAGGVRKALLKKIALKWLPQEIVNRRKVGFEMPLGDWLRPGGPLSHRVEALRDANSFAGSVANRKSIEQLITEHNSRTVNRADILWTLIALDVWAQVFLGPRVRSERLPGAETGKSLELIGGSR